MFNFFNTIFIKITSLVAGAIIAVGIVSMPEPVVINDLQIGQPEKIVIEEKLGTEKEELTQEKTEEKNPEIEMLKKEIEELKKSQNNSFLINSPSPSPNLLPTPITKITPTPTPTPIPTPTEKNYYIETKYRLKTLIDINEAFEKWLQDTSDQFRSASLTLAGYSYGGLYGEMRDAAIDLANSNISVISSMQTNTKEWISYWESGLEILNSDSAGFVDKSILDSIKNPKDLEVEIEGIKKSINLDLDSVLGALKYH